VIKLGAIQAVVTDIEGTTSSLEFVTERLFPYARRHLPDYVRTHAAELGDIAEQIGAATGRRDLDSQALIEILLQWMDEDRKIAPLKSLQGMIWRAGYQHGELRGHVYADAVHALRRWQASGIRVCIYSSGSVEAQKLLFSHSEYGDLTPLISLYFDTTTGSKLEVRSYERIGAALALPAHSIVFLSDHPGETQAAAAAGMNHILVTRTESSASGEPGVRSFDEIWLSRESVR
jgi:enolase-phosphatase E1